MTRILVTGAAGFIGSHVCEYFLSTGHSVIGLDNFNDYYDPSIKQKNCADLKNRYPEFQCIWGDIRDANAVSNVFSDAPFHTVIHLAAMAGVRPSLQNPALYQDVNLTGTMTLFEAARMHDVQKILFASSSSVYGNNHKVPFAETDPVDHPISPYAATKKAGELLAYTYHHLYQIPIACLRFFTVYGPRQRPEMAIHKFAASLLSGTPIDVYSQGLCERDYTYIDDIVSGIVAIWESDYTYDIVNLGNSDTISTLDLIKKIEQSVGRSAKLNLLPAQPGDVDKTYADITHANRTYGYSPRTNLDIGIPQFIDWLTAQEVAS
jgi:UDP-glucuronate 4-epimerase